MEFKILLFFLAVSSSILWALALARALSHKERLSVIEFFFLCLLSYIVQTLSAGLVLGSVGVYKIFNLIILYVISAFIGGTVYWQNRKSLLLFLNNKYQILSIVSLLILAIWLFSYFGEVHLDGRDNGNYLNASISLANSGSTVTVWTHIQQLPENLKSSVISMHHGIYRLTPDFILSNTTGDNLFSTRLDGLPAFLSLGYLLFGLKGIYMNFVLIGITAILSIFCFGNRFFASSQTAIFSSLFYVLSLPLIWAVRMGLTEPLSQAVLMGGLWALWIAHKNYSTAWSAVSAILLGSSLVTHVLNWVMVISIAIYASLVLLADTEKTKKWLLLRFLPLFLIIGILASTYNSRFDFLYMNVLQVKKLMLTVQYTLVFVVVVFIFMFITQFFSPKLLNLIKQQKAKMEKTIVWLSGTILFLLVFYGYLIRPNLSTISPDGVVEYSRYAFRWFVWYITPICMLGSLGGLFWWLKKSIHKFDPIFLPFIVSSLLFSVMLGSSVGLAEHEHFWLTRRYVPIMLPAFILFFSYFLSELFKHQNKYTTILSYSLILLVLSYQLFILSPHINKKELHGYSQSLSKMTDLVPKDASLLIVGDWSIVNFIKEVKKIEKVYPIKTDNLSSETLNALASNLMQKGDVYLLMYRGLLDFPLSNYFQEVMKSDVVYSQSERTIDRVPKKWNTLTNQYILGRFKVSGIRENFRKPYLFRLSAEDIKYSDRIYSDRWLREKTLLLLPEIRSQNPVSLVLVSDGIQPSIIRITLNNAHLANVELKSGVSRYEIPVPLIHLNKAKTTNILEIKLVEGGLIPKQKGIGIDDRLLYMRLKEMQIIEKPLH